MGGYPMMLYRDGAGVSWDGRPTVRRIVESKGEHDSATREGWQTAAEYWSEKPPTAKENATTTPGPKRGRPRKSGQ